MKVYTVEVKKSNGWVVVCKTYDKNLAYQIMTDWTNDGYTAIVM